MKPILITEIVSALISLAALAILVMQAIRAMPHPLAKAPLPGRGHTVIASVLCISATIHGIAAVTYGSGAPAGTYVLGWVSLAMFALSGACMHPRVKCHLHSPAAAHLALFAMGVALFVMHAVVGRL